MKIAAVAYEMIHELPEAIREAIADVQLRVMDAPTAEMVEDLGIDRAEPGAFVQRGEDPMPLTEGMTEERPERVIYLFAGNLQPATPARVREVLAHEIAHACGLDENEVRESLGGVAA